jgi:hypothetical protein
MLHGIWDGSMKRHCDVNEIEDVSMCRKGSIDAIGTRYRFTRCLHLLVSFECGTAHFHI